MKKSSILLMSALAACGGQVQGPGESSSGHSDLGGAAGPDTTPSTGGSSSAIGGSLSSGARATGGASTTVGHSTSGGMPGTGGVVGTGGAPIHDCSTTQEGWTLCVTNSGAPTNSSETKSKGGNNCATPTAATYVLGSNYAGYAFAFISLGPTQGDILDCALAGHNALCLSGTVESTENSPEGLSMVGAVGFNLAQSEVPDSPANPLPGIIKSVTVNFTNSSESELRLQVNQGGAYYCYDLSLWNVGFATGSITLAASQFVTSCWDYVGDAWDGTGATGIQLVAPSSSSMIKSPTAFSACLNSIAIEM